MYLYAEAAMVVLRERTSGSVDPASRRREVPEGGHHLPPSQILLFYPERMSRVHLLRMGVLWCRRTTSCRWLR